jgi:hypothetical protein
VDAKGILAVHNRERAAVGVPPLVWSDKLAADAKSWTDHLVTTGQIAHASYGERQGEGENIAWDYNDASGQKPDAPGMVGGWVNEKTGYHVAPFLWDRDKAHGHYTQMVTWDVKAIGCAIAALGPPGQPFSGQVKGHILLCRYSPSHANVDGYAPYTISP